MQEHDQLLEQAKNFCDPATGEVLQRIPEELMKGLRAAKLARGVPGKRSDHTETYATWFVFLNDSIREQVLAQWREANRQRRRRHTATAKAKRPPDATVPGSKSEASGARGLQQFRQHRKSAK